MAMSNLSALSHRTIDAVLDTAATLLDMEVVFLGGLTEDLFRVERLRGGWPGVDVGLTLGRTDSLCHHMLAGTAGPTCDAVNDPVYGALTSTRRLGIRSYVGVPVRDQEGRIVATLCGIDRGRVPVDEASLGVLEELAQIITAQFADTSSGVVIRRTPAGWRVGDQDEDGESRDLTSAMALADLLAGEIGPGARPARPGQELDELGQLKLSVTQLEHALAARVVVEQAIGVLAERQRTTPRDAFERLRRVARSRGRRVHDLAREVVASAASPGTPLPPELAGRR